MAQLAIAWVLAQPGITSAIVGASRPEQLRETAAAADLAIDPALLAEAAAILEGVRVS
jgi:aryl-alcohol dehydrogenase-like predicted oxidoreductase